MGGHLQENIQRDDLEGRPQLIEYALDACYVTPLPNVHEEEIGTNIVDGGQFPQVGHHHLRLLLPNT